MVRDRPKLLFTSPVGEEILGKTTGIKTRVFKNGGDGDVNRRTSDGTNARAVYVGGSGKSLKKIED